MPEASVEPPPEPLEPPTDFADSPDLVADASLDVPADDGGEDDFLA
jgi:hypothetical protein